MKNTRLRTCLSLLVIGATTMVSCSKEDLIPDDLFPKKELKASKSTTPTKDASAFKVSFSQDFDKDLDPAVWNDHIWYEDSNPTKNFAVEDGKLKIWPERDSSGNFFNRTIDTDRKYEQTYGFFEIKAKLPYGKGVWPAFWLFNHEAGDSREEWDYRPEIDIMEAYPGGGPESGWSDERLRPTAFASTIWTGNTVQAGSKTIATPDLSAGFHTYAVKWEEKKITFYFDDEEVYTNDVEMSDPMYILLDLWFGSASGQPDNTTPTGPGNAFEVEYCRAWKFIK